MRESSSSSCPPTLSYILFRSRGTTGNTVGFSVFRSSDSSRMSPWKYPILAPCTNITPCQPYQTDEGVRSCNCLMLNETTVDKQGLEGCDLGDYRNYGNIPVLLSQTYEPREEMKCGRHCDATDSYPKSQTQEHRHRNTNTYRQGRMDTHKHTEGWTDSQC